MTSPNQKKANRALEDVMPKAGKKTALAIEDGRASGDEEESEACSTKGKDGQVVEVEVLSEVGKSVHKKEAGLRVGRMVKLVKEVKKNLGKEKGKSLDATLASLDKLQKQGNKIKVEDAKSTLFDAAIQIKKAKKT